MRCLFSDFLALLVSAFIMGGCSSNGAPAQVLTYDLMNVTEGAELRFTDMVEDIRIVPLETGSDFFIPDSKYLIDEQYIVTVNDNAIHQFDAYTGKHIRILAVSGNGPKEFNNIASSYIANHTLYYSVHGKGYLYAIDLNTGEHLPPYTTKYEYLAFVGGTKNDELYVPDDSLLFERYNFKTQKSSVIVDTLVKHKKSRNAENVLFLMGFASGGFSVSVNRDEVFYYNIRYSDTLYINAPQKLLPYAYFVMPEDDASKMVGGLPNGEQFKLIFPYVDSHWIMCNLAELSIKSSSNMVNINLILNGLYTIDRETGKAKKINKYIFDPLFVHEYVENGSSENQKGVIGNAVFGFRDHWFTNEKIYARALSAYKVKEYIKDSLEDSDFPENKKGQLRELDSKLSNEDNPVVFIGNKK